MNVPNIRPVERPEKHQLNAKDVGGMQLCASEHIALECRGWFLWTFATVKLTQ